jgi:2-hydroxy-3-oxopropionate reductase
MKERIGFIGLGIMGKPMALNLLKAGYPLVVWSGSRNAGELQDEGAELAHSYSEIAEVTDVVITMLPNSPQVKSVYLDEKGVLEGAKPGLVCIDMSSIAPLASQEVGAALKNRDVEMLDAPVSGGQEKAEKGTLAIMVGGKGEVVEKCRPILEVMGGSVTHVGDLGAGQTTKLVNQAIVAVNIAVISEALSLGKKAGVDPENIFNAIKGGLAGSQCLNDKAPRMFSGNYDPGFRIGLHVKDLSNVMETANSLHLSMPLTSQVMEMMQVLMADGYDDRDHGGLALYFEKMNSLSLKE